MSTTIETNLFSIFVNIGFNWNLIDVINDNEYPFLSVGPRFYLDKGPHKTYEVALIIKVSFLLVDMTNLRAHHERGQHLINILVNGLEGTYFLESIDASGEQRNAILLAHLLENIIDNIGINKVVQVVTYNCANYKNSKIIQEANYSSQMGRFIYRHGRILIVTREKIGGMDLPTQASRCIESSICGFLIKNKQAVVPQIDHRLYGIAL
ncbi:hypothetical protein ACJX0J_019447 [Zea mays]